MGAQWSLLMHSDELHNCSLTFLFTWYREYNRWHLLMYSSSTGIDRIMSSWLNVLRATCVLIGCTRTYTFCGLAIGLDAASQSSVLQGVCMKCSVQCTSFEKK